MEPTVDTRIIDTDKRHGLNLGSDNDEFIFDTREEGILEVTHEIQIDCNGSACRAVASVLRHVLVMLVKEQLLLGPADYIDSDALGAQSLSMF
mmetsp:Transcript_11055/g.32787  ORF Transcript_11055/g.32787 Transcript_11055/m.32787 type:complete len:93 (+) Transcript_11055:1724-2002(+)